ncbi:MAG: DUF6463 family protein [Thermodesulfobacteriota bacterium]
MKMKNEYKRIHGRLLLITGILHLIVTLLPGIFGKQILDFASHGFFNINKGLLAFPLFGGTLDNESFSAFWFFYMVPIMLMLGHLIDNLEQINGFVPRQTAIHFLIVSLIGAYMVPISGMTFFLVPQAVYMLVRSQ